MFFIAFSTTNFILKLKVLEKKNIQSLFAFISLKQIKVHRFCCWLLCSIMINNNKKNGWEA